MATSVRTFWKGHLRLALVTIPVRLVSAARTETDVTFHQVDRKTKQRVRYMKVVPGKGEVQKDDIVMGYEVEPGNYVLFEGDELDALKLETRHTIELTQFVDAQAIDPLYFERPYYVVPDGDVADEGYRVIRDALRAKNKVGIGQLTLRGRENLVALYPGGNGLVLDTLRYAEEIKNADDVFSDLGASTLRPDMVQMAEDLVAGRSGPFDPKKFKNHYAEALRELVHSKLQSGQNVAVEDSEKQGGKVLDFMEALKRSVAASAGEGAPDTSPTAAKPAKMVQKPAIKAAKSAKAAKTSKPPPARQARRKAS